MYNGSQLMGQVWSMSRSLLTSDLAFSVDITVLWGVGEEYASLMFNLWCLQLISVSLLP